MFSKKNKMYLFFALLSMFVIEIYAQNNANLSSIITEWTANIGDLSEFRYSLDVSSISTDFESKISVYPNPTDGILYINNTLEEDLEINVFDTSGSLLFNNKSTNKENDIDLSKLSNGVYFIKIKDNSNNSIVKKIIKL